MDRGLVDIYDGAEFQFDAPGLRCLQLRHNFLSLCEFFALIFEDRRKA